MWSNIKKKKKKKGKRKKKSPIMLHCMLNKGKWQKNDEGP